MSRLRLAPVVLLALLGLAACASTTAGPSPSLTATTLASPTATLAPAPTPANVPTGWSVLAGLHFSLAYPSGWTIQTVPPHSNFNGTLYAFILPSGTASGIRVTVTPQAQGADLGAYCLPSSNDVQHVTLAGLPMAYTLSGENLVFRSWYFANTQHTAYALQASDADADAATQAQDEAILAIFTPDSAAPLSC